MLMSPMQTKKEEVKMLCKADNNIFLCRVVKCPGPNVKFYSTRATNMLIKFVLCFSGFFSQKLREGGFGVITFCTNFLNCFI